MQVFLYICVYICSPDNTVWKPPLPNTACPSSCARVCFVLDTVFYWYCANQLISTEFKRAIVRILNNIVPMPMDQRLGKSAQHLPIFTWLQNHMHSPTEMRCQCWRWQWGSGGLFKRTGISYTKHAYAVRTINIQSINISQQNTHGPHHNCRYIPSGQKPASFCHNGRGVDVFRVDICLEPKRPSSSSINTLAHREFALRMRIPHMCMYAAVCTHTDT